MTAFTHPNLLAKFIRKCGLSFFGIALVFYPSLASAQLDPDDRIYGSHLWYLQVAVCGEKNDTSGGSTCFYWVNETNLGGLQYKRKITTYKWATVAGPYYSWRDCDDEDKKYVYQNINALGRKQTLSHDCRYVMRGQEKEVQTFSENPMPLKDLLNNGYWSLLPNSLVAQPSEETITGDIRDLSKGSKAGSFILCNKVGNCFQFKFSYDEVKINGQFFSEVHFPDRAMVKYHVTEDGTNVADSIKTLAPTPGNIMTGEIRDLSEGSTLGSFNLCNKSGKCFEFAIFEPGITINGKHLAQTSFPKRGTVKYHIDSYGNLTADQIKTL